MHHDGWMIDDVGSGHSEIGEVERRNECIATVDEKLRSVVLA